MKKIVLASILVFTFVAGASAQQPAAPPVPPASAPAPVPAAAPAAPALPVVFPPAPPWRFTSPALEFPHLPDLTHGVGDLHDSLFEFDSLALHGLHADLEALTLARQEAKPKPFKEPIVYVGTEPLFKGGSPESWYSQARGFIERDQYDRALEPLDRVIGAKADRADAAMYWKAYSLSKLARRDEALTTLGQLQKQYADSRWVRDARSLEVELKQAAGQAVSTTNADDDIKLLALQGVLRTDPDAALPVVEKMLSGNASVRVKERALFVVSQHRSDKARTILGTVARSGSNPDLQQRAIRYLGMSNSPDAVASLLDVYKTDTSLETRKTVISALAQNNNPAATNALITLARAEKNPELKTLMVRHLANQRSPEAKAFMLELLK